MESKAKLQQRQTRGYKQMRDAASNIWNEASELDRRAALSLMAIANYLEFGRAFRGQVVAEVDNLSKHIVTKEQMQSVKLA